MKNNLYNCVVNPKHVYASNILCVRLKTEWVSKIHSYNKKCFKHPPYIIYSFNLWNKHMKTMRNLRRLKNKEILKSLLNNEDFIHVPKRNYGCHLVSKKSNKKLLNLSILFPLYILYTKLHHGSWKHSMSLSQIVQLFYLHWITKVLKKYVQCL